MNLLCVFQAERTPYPARPFLDLGLAPASGDDSVAAVLIVYGVGAHRRPPPEDLTVAYDVVDRVVGRLDAGSGDISAVEVEEVSQSTRVAAYLPGRSSRFFSCCPPRSWSPRSTRMEKVA